MNNKIRVLFKKDDNWINENNANIYIYIKNLD